MIRLIDNLETPTGNSEKIASLVNSEKSLRAVCERLTIKAYKNLLASKNYRLEWEEDTFSINLKERIEDLCVLEDIALTITYQEPQPTPEILSGEKSPKSAKRMDMVFATFPNPKRFKYGLEAKIVASSNSRKRNAKSLCSEYICSGMDRFIQGDYSMGGCMVGYVVQGNSCDVQKLINKILHVNGRGAEILKERHAIETYSSCYNSYHKTCALKHILLQFT